MCSCVCVCESLYLCDGMCACPVPALQLMLLSLLTRSLLRVGRVADEAIRALLPLPDSVECGNHSLDRNAGPPTMLLGTASGRILVLDLTSWTVTHRLHAHLGAVRQLRLFQLPWPPLPLSPPGPNTGSGNQPFFNSNPSSNPPAFAAAAVAVDGYADADDESSAASLPLTSAQLRTRRVPGVDGRWHVTAASVVAITVPFAAPGLVHAPRWCVSVGDDDVVRVWDVTPTIAVAAPAAVGGFGFGGGGVAAGSIVVEPRAVHGWKVGAAEATGGAADRVTDVVVTAVREACLCGG